MKVWAVCLVCLFSLSIPLHGFARSDLAPRQTLTGLANRVYEAVSNQTAEMAIDALNTFEKTWEEVERTDHTISPIASRTVTTQVETLRETLENNEDRDQWNAAGVTFRLAVDAVVNAEHPLWMGMRDKVLGSFQKIIRDVNEDQDRAFQTDFNHFLSLYQMIYPSLVIDEKRETAQLLESEINHIMNDRMTIVQNKTMHLPHLQKTYEDLKKIFGSSEAVSGFLHTSEMWPPSVIIGGIVLLTLLYVTWRKYRGEGVQKEIPVTKR